MRFEQFYLDEVTSEEKFNKQYNGKLDRELFDKAVTLDPTSNGDQKVGKFTDWIIRQKAYDDGSLKNLLAMFDRHKDKIPPESRDVNRLNVDELKDVIQTADNEGKLVSKSEKKDERRAKAEAESDVVFDDDQYIVIHPKTKYASQYFGANSDWCTARQSNDCNFDKYNARGNLYIIYDKNATEDKYKYQMFINNDDPTDFEFRDYYNNDFDPVEKFANNTELLDKLKSLGMKTELSDKEIEDFAYDHVNHVFGRGFENAEQARDVVIDSVKDLRNNYDDYFGTALIDVNQLNDKYRNDKYNVKYILDVLSKKFGVDADSGQNKFIVFEYVLGEDDVSWVEDDIDNGDNDWDEEGIKAKGFETMGLESTIERIADHMSKGEELLDEDFENLKKSLEINYDKYKDKDLYEYILDQFEDNNIELVETDKEELKKIIDILEHKKSETRDENPQTKLQLDHKKYKNSLVESINYFLGED